MKKKDPRDTKNWKPLITHTPDGTPVYCETFRGKPDEVLYNVVSGSGNIRVNTIETLAADLQDIEGHKVSPFYYGHRMLIEDYDDIVNEENRRMISWIDLSKELDRSVEWLRNLLGFRKGGRVSEKPKGLQPTALKGIWVDGASLWVKDLGTAAEIIREEMKRRRTYRAKQGAKARWGDKVDPSSRSENE